MQHTPPLVHVLGDFDFRDIVWPETDQTKLIHCLVNFLGEILTEIVNDYGLEQLVHFPTRERNTLDLISNSFPGQFVDIHSPDRLSEHDMVSGTLKVIILPVKKPKRKVCGYQKGDCESCLFFFLEKYSNYFGNFTCWLPGERLLPFGLLF